MADPRDDTTHVPLLPETHSGIPRSLLEKAKEAKAHVLSVRTKTTGARKKGLAYPPGVEANVFDGAIDELRGQLGADHVVLNDQPLQDG
ncbi:hypothetical protein F4802DRAFT_498718 [Xylaria palmicola]|nr:hypothetical protein F4802DRAFT_498718 [Xylaria palmicola]